VDWQHALQRNWPNLRFGEIRTASDGRKHAFEVQVYLSNLDPDTVQVELFADGLDGGRPVPQAMTRGRQLVGTNGYIYSAQVPSTRPASHYTARVIPRFPGVEVPLEAAYILWQR